MPIKGKRRKIKKELIQLKKKRKNNRYNRLNLF